MLVHPLNNNRGVALLFMVLFFTAAATASVMFIAMGLKVKGIQQEGTTQQRLDEIRTALQNYYLIHYDLPDPSLTTPPNSVPTALLNLPQKYRFDSNGQQIRYDRFDSTPAPSIINDHMVSVQNIQVEGNMVGAVLVAPGPNKTLDATAAPYTSIGNDDLVVAISLEAEALKIANHTVAVLQQAAKAYDAIFYSKNNDADTLFLPPVDSLNNDGTWDPGTKWYDYTEPVQELAQFDCTGGANSGEWIPNGDCYSNVGSTLGVPNGTCTRIDVSGSNIWYPNYAGQIRYVVCASGNFDPNGNGIVPVNDEDVLPRPLLTAIPPIHPIPPVGNADMQPLERPVPLIDEGEIVGAGYDSYVEAKPNLYTPNPGQGCVQLGILSNDPSRGTASLDFCSSGTPAYDLAVVYGLNLVKLGYDTLSGTMLDPWGNPYLWGSAAAYGGLAGSNATNDSSRDRHYWTFFSTGPDGTRDTSDDLLPSADRIPGYWVTPTIPNPIP